jgi:hypothetical protein
MIDTVELPVEEYAKLIADDNDSEMPKMITSFITTSSENWSLTSDIYVRAGTSEGNAKEAAKTLRKAFR